MMMLVIQLFLCAAIIVVAGMKLTAYADIISQKAGLSKAFIGMLLLGFVTSLPEVTTTVASAVCRNAPDLAVGNVLGSNAFNLMIIVLLYYINRKNPIAFVQSTVKSHKISAAFGAGIALFVIFAIWFYGRVNPQGGYFAGVDSAVIALGFVLGFWMLYKAENIGGGSNPALNEPRSSSDGAVTLNQAWFRFALNAAFVVIGGIWLTSVGDKLADATGLGRTFIGSIVFAVVTSFPEVVTCIAAMKAGAVDLAIGNVFGSNLFNLALIPLTDFIYHKGILLAEVSLSHMATALLGVFLTVMVFRGLKTGNRESFFHMRWVSPVMIFGYLLVTYLLFRFK